MTSLGARGRLIAAALAAALLLAVAGCGGDDDDGAASTQAAASTPAAATEGGTDTSGGDESSADAGSSGGGGDFCRQLQDVDDKITSAPDPTSASDVAKTFDEAATALEGVDAPGEISAQWDTLAGTFRGWAEAFQDIDLNDPESLADAQDVLARIQNDQEKLLEATERIAKYASDHCGIDLGDNG
ncbi:MAG: hypothetical protein IRZ32_06120 [Solirubrobacteraceae bacterium]|nr:hypothetical protein [Solirubrobacteraceae bacterium]